MFVVGCRPDLVAAEKHPPSDLPGCAPAVPDSESVDELLEEGNAFEADAVTGVEDAGGADEREVRTHEVPEDDVPEEYLGKK